MKLVVITVAFLATIQIATCTYFSETDSGSKYIMYKVQRSQIERLRSNFEKVCPGYVDQFEESLQQLKECTDEIDENTETACSAVRNYFMRCAKPVIQVLEKCMPEESKEIPSLVFQSVNSGAMYLCKTDGEHIFELGNTCFLKTNLGSMRCERRLRTKLQQYKSKMPTKTEICESITSMKPCLLTHLQDSCGNHITRDSFTGLFDALSTPCRNDGSTQIEYNHINEVELLD